MRTPPDLSQNSSARCSSGPKLSTRVPKALFDATLALVAEPSWTCQHFTLSNAVDDRPDDLPRLLRRVADQLETVGVQPMEILDLTISQEMTVDGPAWSATFYWAPESSEVSSAADRETRT